MRHTLSRRMWRGPCLLMALTLSLWACAASESASQAPQILDEPITVPEQTDNQMMTMEESSDDAAIPTPNAEQRMPVTRVVDASVSPTNPSADDSDTSDDQEIDSSTVAPAPLDGGIDTDLGVDATPPACDSLPTRQACDQYPHCWFGAPGCSEDEQATPLPPRLMGCQPLTLRCENAQCGDGHECRTVLNDPCAGQLCDRCAEPIQVCLPEEQNAQLCGTDRPICPADEYCQFNRGDVCGAVGRPGVCRPLPVDCTADCQQVCGCDGQTYCNACEAASTGRTDVRFMGVCPMTPPPPPDDRCLQMSHPDVRVIGRGDACEALQFDCQPDELRYQDQCSCGCVFNGGNTFACDTDDDCVPEDCCRPTGCVAQNSAQCEHDEFELGCFAADCRPAIAGCGCVDGLCRTAYGQDCE